MRRLLAFAALAFLAAASAAAELKPWAGGATPPLALQDLPPRQKAHNLSDYRGKVVLVNFWGDLVCSLPRRSTPSIDRLRCSLEGRPFEVLAVNLAEPLSLASRSTSTPCRSASRCCATATARRRRPGRRSLLPASYLVGRDGRIRYVAYGGSLGSQPVRRRVNELLQ